MFAIVFDWDGTSLYRTRHDTWAFSLAATFNPSCVLTFDCQLDAESAAIAASKRSGQVCYVVRVA